MNRFYILNTAFCGLIAALCAWAIGCGDSEQVGPSPLYLTPLRSVPRPGDYPPPGAAADGSSAAPASNAARGGPLGSSSATGSAQSAASAPSGGVPSAMGTAGGAALPAMPALPNAGVPGSAMPGTSIPGTSMPGTSMPGTPAVAEKAPAAPSAGMLTVRFATVSQGARYSPQNVGAVWIEDAAGAFVKTLERWASSRARFLKRWTAASGGWPAGRAATGANPDQMDAVSRATLRTEQKHEMTWDMRDAKGNLVPDGTYHVVVEVTEVDGTGPNDAVAFDKGPMPSQLMPSDKAPYATMSLEYQP